MSSYVSRVSQDGSGQLSVVSFGSTGQLGAREFSLIANPQTANLNLRPGIASLQGVDVTSGTAGVDLGTKDLSLPFLRLPSESSLIGQVTIQQQLSVNIPRQGGIGSNIHIQTLDAFGRFDAGDITTGSISCTHLSALSSSGLDLSANSILVRSIDCQAVLSSGASCEGLLSGAPLVCQDLAFENCDGSDVIGNLVVVDRLECANLTASDSLLGSAQCSNAASGPLLATNLSARSLDILSLQADNISGSAEARCSDAQVSLLGSQLVKGIEIQCVSANTNVACRQANLDEVSCSNAFAESFQVQEMDIDTLTCTAMRVPNLLCRSTSTFTRRVLTDNVSTDAFDVPFTVCSNLTSNLANLGFAEIELLYVDNIATEVVGGNLSTPLASAGNLLAGNLTVTSQVNLQKDLRIDSLVVPALSAAGFAFQNLEISGTVRLGVFPVGSVVQVICDEGFAEVIVPATSRGPLEVRYDHGALYARGTDFRLRSSTANWLQSPLAVSESFFDTLAVVPSEGGRPCTVNNLLAHEAVLQTANMGSLITGGRVRAGNIPETLIIDHPTVLLGGFADGTASISFFGTFVSITVANLVPFAFYVGARPDLSYLQEGGLVLVTIHSQVGQLTIEGDNADLAPGPGRPRGAPVPTYAGNLLPSLLAADAVLVDVSALAIDSHTMQSNLTALDGNMNMITAQNSLVGDLLTTAAVCGNVAFTSASSLSCSVGSGSSHTVTGNLAGSLITSSLNAQELLCSDASGDFTTIHLACENIYSNHCGVNQVDITDVGFGNITTVSGVSTSISGGTMNAEAVGVDECRANLVAGLGIHLDWVEGGSMEFNHMSSYDVSTLSTLVLVGNVTSLGAQVGDVYGSRLQASTLLVNGNVVVPIGSSANLQGFSAPNVHVPHLQTSRVVSQESMLGNLAASSIQVELASAIHLTANSMIVETLAFSELQTESESFSLLTSSGLDGFRLNQEAFTVGNIQAGDISGGELAAVSLASTQGTVDQVLAQHPVQVSLLSAVAANLGVVVVQQTAILGNFSTDSLLADLVGDVDIAVGSLQEVAANVVSLEVAQFGEVNRQDLSMVSDTSNTVVANVDQVMSLHATVQDANFDTLDAFEMLLGGERFTRENKDGVVGDMDISGSMTTVDLQALDISANTAQVISVNAASFTYETIVLPVSRIQPNLDMVTSGQYLRFSDSIEASDLGALSLDVGGVTAGGLALSSINTGNVTANRILSLESEVGVIQAASVRTGSLVADAHLGRVEEFPFETDEFLCFFDAGDYRNPVDGWKNKATGNAQIKSAINSSVRNHPFGLPTIDASDAPASSFTLPGFGDERNLYGRSSYVAPGLLATGYFLGLQSTFTCMFSANFATELLAQGYYIRFPNLPKLDVTPYFSISPPTHAFGDPSQGGILIPADQEWHTWCIRRGPPATGSWEVWQFNEDGSYRKYSSVILWDAQENDTSFTRLRFFSYQNPSASVFWGGVFMLYTRDLTYEEIDHNIAYFRQTYRTFRNFSSAAVVQGCRAGQITSDSLELGGRSSAGDLHVKGLGLDLEFGNVEASFLGASALAATSATIFGHASCNLLSGAEPVTMGNWRPVNAQGNSVVTSGLNATIIRGGTLRANLLAVTEVGELAPRVGTFGSLGVSTLDSANVSLKDSVAVSLSGQVQSSRVGPLLSDSSSVQVRGLTIGPSSASDVRAAAVSAASFRVAGLPLEVPPPREDLGAFSCIALPRGVRVYFGTIGSGVIVSQARAFNKRPNSVDLSQAADFVRFIPGQGVVHAGFPSGQPSLELALMNVNHSGTHFFRWGLADLPDFPKSQLLLWMDPATYNGSGVWLSSADPYRVSLGETPGEISPEVILPEVNRRYVIDGVRIQLRSGHAALQKGAGRWYQFGTHATGGTFELVQYPVGSFTVALAFKGNSSLGFRKGVVEGDNDHIGRWHIQVVRRRVTPGTSFGFVDRWTYFEELDGSLGSQSCTYQLNVTQGELSPDGWYMDAEGLVGDILHWRKSLALFEVDQVVNYLARKFQVGYKSVIRSGPVAPTLSGATLVDSSATGFVCAGSPPLEIDVLDLGFVVAASSV